MKSANIIVVGGGIIGVSLAYGMAEQGEKVTVLDNGRGVNNASRGNFGLVWVQGKGQGMPHYAEWTLQSPSSLKLEMQIPSHRTGQLAV